MIESMQLKTLRDNAGMRWLALAFVALTMFFAYMFVDILSPVKTMVESEFNWNSTVFGTYGGSEFFINVFFFFLIFAGIILDKMGVRFTFLLSGSLMVIGALIKLYALSSVFNDGGFGYSFLSSFSPAMPASAKLACVGFAIFGCGTEMGGVTVSRSIVKWFEGKEMALAMGLEMAVARLGVFAVFWVSPMIAERYGTVRASVFFGTCLLVVALLLYVVYFFMDKKLDQQLEASHAAVQQEEEEPFKFRDLGHVFGNSMFWIVAILCVLYYSAIFPFQKFATEMLVSNVGFDADIAAKIFSLFPVGAMIITPILGSYLDARGRGATMLMVGAILMIVCHGTFTFFPFGNVSHGLATIIAVAAIVILGISFSLVPAALWPSVPKIIPGKVLGSAYSAIFWIQNIGLMSVPILIGKILDVNNQNVAPGEPKDYFQAMLLFTAFGIVALVTAILLKVADKKKGYGLELPNIRK